MATKIQEIVAGLLALDDLQSSVGFKSKMATASDPQAMTKKIEALRRQFKEQSLQVAYESKQKLAGLLREITHVLTDLIHAMNVNGEDASAMAKLQSQIGKVTKSLSFVGEDDADGDGFKDNVQDEANINLGQGKNTDESHQAFKDAVKSIKTDAPKSEEKQASPEKKAEPVAPVKEETKKPAPKEDVEESEDEGSDEAEEDVDNEDAKPAPPKLKKKKVALPKKDKGSEKEKGDEGGFVSSLLAESSYTATAGFRFVYLGPKSVRKAGESFTAICAGFGSHSMDTFKVYYYKPTIKFFKGDATKADTAFKKILANSKGYSKLSSELNALVKSGHLEIVSKKEQDASEILQKSEDSWSYRGIGQHPKAPDNPDKKALWFEIRGDEFAAIPASKFESGNAEEADSYIKVNIIGSKEGGAGKPYIDGLKALESLVDAGRLKVIYHGKV